MKAFKIMLFSVLVLGLLGCSAPQTSENTSPLIRSQTPSEPSGTPSCGLGRLAQHL